MSSTLTAWVMPAGLGRRINTVMQTCFFALSGVLPRAQAIAAVKQAIHAEWDQRLCIEWEKCVMVSARAVRDSLRAGVPRTRPAAV